MCICIYIYVYIYREREREKSIYPPPRLRKWRAKGVSFLSVCCVSRMLFSCVFTVGMLTVGMLTVGIFTVGMFTAGMFTVGMFTVGLVLFMSQGLSRFSAVDTTCVPFWCQF